MKKLKLMLFLICTLVVFGAAPDAQAIGGNVFSVYLQYPQGQIEPDVGYFYFAAQPDESVTLTVNAVNDSESDILLYVESADAYTSSGGELVYVTQNTSNALGYADPKFMMSPQITSSVASFTLGPGETNPISISVKVPDIANSEFIGAVRFYTLSAGEAQQSGSYSGVEVNVKSAQTVPIRIVTGELSPSSGPVLTISSVAFDDVESQFFFTAENSLPFIGTLDKLTYEVTGPSGDSVIRQEISPVKLAPRTNFRIYLDWAGIEAIPGDYTMKLSYVYESDETIESRTFKVEKSEAEALPTPSTSAAPSPGGIYISTATIIAVGFAVVLIILLLYIISRRKNHNRSDNKTDR